MFNLRNILVIIGLAVIYGLGLRLLFGSEFYNFGEMTSLMSYAFLAFMPVVVGFITMYLSNSDDKGWIYHIFMPWIPMTILVLVSFLFFLEGAICIAMALPIFLICSSLGGVTAMAIKRSSRNRINLFVLNSFLLIPLVTVPIESNIPKAREIIEVNTSIMIHANDKEVWDNIVKVYEIDKNENETTMFIMMGFPRPIKAELDKEGVGGIRKAIFDKGLFFTETVTEWNEMKSFTFTIEADPNSIPPEALDEHVTVGGDLFDVLEGKYELEQRPDGVMLHLSSKFRLSTGINFYSKIWSEAIMKDIQDNILYVIKQRCEK